MKSVSSLRVLELSGTVAGAYCSKLFAGLGAQVDRLPRPGAAEFLSAEEHAWFNTAKRDLHLDANAPQARATLEKLIGAADVLIDDWGVDALAAYGFDEPALRARWPQLVYCQITPFGASGPYRGFAADDITLYAMSGLMNSTGDGAREPLNAQPKIARLTAGLNAYVGIQLALMRRTRDGVGESIDLSVQESAIENLETALSDHLHLKKMPRRNNDNHSLVPWRTYPCKDGTVALIGGPIRKWLDAAPLFGEPRLLTEEFAHIKERIAKRAEFEALLRPWLQSHGQREIFEAGQKIGMAWGFIASLPETLADEQLDARGYFVEMEHPRLGRGRMPGQPFRGAAVPWRDQPAPAVALPAASVAAEPRAQVAPRHSGTRAAPLAGIRVVDFTHDWAGPHTTRLLADYGAEVIKVEHHHRLDSSRGGYKREINNHPRFWNLHRGKRSAALDLKDPKHLQVCRELIRKADVVIENSRPGVMVRLGLGYEDVRRLRSDIIMISMSGFGADGPRRSYAGYGANLEALSGFQSLTAYDEKSPQYRVREMDVLNSIMSACALTSALWHRQVTGEGQFIEFSELEGCSWYIGEHFLRASREGQPPVLGNRHARFAPQGCYPCAGEDRWLTIAVRSDAEWQCLARVLGGAALDPRYASLAARRAEHDALDTLISTWTRGRDAVEAMGALQTVDVPAGVVYSCADLGSDPHLAERQWFLETPEGRFPGLPFRLLSGGSVWRRRGPDLGEYNAEAFAAAGVDGPLPDLRPEAIGTAYDMR
jgi:crotonobetainyl-CoA:carnitine CoA-transferase CaiB-like acyl-CoA transferase